MDRHARIGGWGWFQCYLLLVVGLAFSAAAPGEDAGNDRFDVRVEAAAADGSESGAAGGARGGDAPASVSVPAGGVSPLAALFGGQLQILAANDLGMHCADQDYRIFSILPPFNVVHAQVIRRGTQDTPPAVLSGADAAGLEVVYSAVANPDDPVLSDPLNPPSPLVDAVRASRSINTTSQNDLAADIFKTNFWNTTASGRPYGFDAYAVLYFGLLRPADVMIDTGLPVPDSVLLNPLDQCLADLSACLGQQAMPGVSQPYVANARIPFDRFDTDFNFFSSVLPPPLGAVVSNANWYAADGVPVVPIDDAGRVNPYPLMRIEAVQGGVSQASVDLVLPVASEADCQLCHAETVDCADLRLPERLQTTACNGSAVSPTRFSGTVFTVATINDAPGATPEQQLLNAAKINILRLHDAKHGLAYTGAAGESTPCNTAVNPAGPNCLAQQTPVQCSQCHYSPALDIAQKGPVDGDPSSGLQQRRHITMSRAMHAYHGQFTELFPSMPAPDDPARTPEVANQVLEQTCYSCHPGKRTACLRGAMFSGGAVCQDCHGNMEQVGNDFSGQLALNNPYPGGANLDLRVPWASEPKCQSCHVGDAVTVAQMNTSDFILAHDGIRLRQTYRKSDANKSALPMIQAPASRFAENENLYRLSKGHGGVMCEGCHGSTHAVWPVANPLANDNLAARQLQGHAGTVVECSVCHAAGSLGLTLGGPHGMHPVGDQRWNEEHSELFERRADDCRACHGRNGEGAVLARMAQTRTLRCDEEGLPRCDSDHRITLQKGEQVSCGVCHENELGGRRSASR